VRFLDMAVRPVLYQDLLQDNERKVWKALSAASPMHYGEIRQFVLYALGDAVGLEVRKSETDSVYLLAQLRVAQALFAASQAVGTSGTVVLVSQSLGCQVLSNYFYDAQKAARGDAVAAGIWSDIDAHAQAVAGRPFSAEEKAFLGGRGCRRWLSTGCNIPVFIAAHHRMAIRPIEPLPGRSADFQWLNLYDPDDVLGWPMAGLSDEYARLVEDRPINAGQGLVDWIFKSWNPMSHTTYWTDDDVIRPLLEMLREFL
jgi:hypothetical protein